MSGQSPEPGILFDLDGTLVDTVYQHVLAWSTAIARAGMSVPAWAIHRRIGMSGRSMLQQLLRGQRVSSVVLKKIEEGHDRAFKKLSIDVRPLPGAKELVRHLTRIGIPWAIATTGGQMPTRRLLRHLDISDKVVVVTGDDVAKAKPSPYVFLTRHNV
jgi:beta-phosphoglucomutase-like phosphatase (HAD superfamily)